MKNLKFLYRAYRYRYKVDPLEISYILNNVKSGQIAVDIGAHKGGYLYWLQKQVGQTGKVFAFEPQPSLYQYLSTISKKMGYTNTIIENKGFSAKTGQLDFHIPLTKSGSSPGARIDFFEKAEAHQTILIEVTTLDDYFLPKNIFPNFLKIDVEGHEKQVLLGGQELLKQAKPKILMECEARHLKSGDVYEVFDVLLSMGYKGYFFDHKSQKPLNDFKPFIHQKRDEGRFWEADKYINNFIFEKQ